MTLSWIDRQQITVHMKQMLTSQQVAMSHRGLFIDGLLNVQVVLIDPARSSRTTSQWGQRAAGQGNLKAIRHKWVHNRWCEQIIVADQALKNTDHSDYLFSGSTPGALTPAKRLRDVQVEVQSQRVPLTALDHCPPC